MLMMSTASSNNGILSEAMQALDDNVYAPQTPANEDNAARVLQVQAQAPPQPPMQLDKPPLESFSGDITQFEFWRLSRVTQLSLVNLFDEKLTLTLTTKGVITLSQRPPHLSGADIEFIRREGYDMPLCHSCEPVLPDILVGIDAYWDVVTSDPPVELPSGFSRGSPPRRYPHTNSVADTPEDDKAIERLWLLDSLGIVDDHHPDADTELDQRVLDKFYNTSQLINGYLKLSHAPEAWSQYAKTIEEHLRAGFIDESRNIAVYKESSSTTKLRVVFDASSRQKEALSLNDCLHQGPTLLPDLAELLLWSRLHRYLLIADVIFLFTRIPFGVNASLFMLSASIQL
ncbi:unnamed protein product [Heligmosomoides polygyrus]|uniref:Uncharacterized protein n=1 Tax=Heligmosomoides polygyrus TaxID=6339 RepID=A0A3P8IFW4_HELPZ|nr:unnamed protein product [Heligmosomoides polygyrus]